MDYLTNILFDRPRTLPSKPIPTPAPQSPK